MKKSLGKLILLLLLQTFLHANPLASYKLFANKTEASLKEPIEIKFIAKQKDHTDNMFFLLEPKKSPDYEIKLLEKTSNDKKDHNSETTFVYIVFPLKVKKIKVDFDFTVQTASDKALKQSYVDDHDGGKAVQMKDSKVKINPLLINIKEIPQDVDLVGDFTLESKCDKTKIAEYDNVNIIYTLKGTGYKIDKPALLKEIANVHQFSDVHDEYSKLTKKGFDSKKIYTYALSAKDNFQIPAIQLKVYSLKKHQVYTLTAPSYSIEVTKINPKTLLDKTDSPISQKLFKGENIKEFFIYIVIFLSGFISAKFTNISFKNRKKSNRFEDIRKTESSKELILVLISKYQNYNIKSFVDELEKAEYENSSKSFDELKKEVLKYLSFK
jgi:hypothetical protein